MFCYTFQAWNIKMQLYMVFGKYKINPSTYSELIILLYTKYLCGFISKKTRQQEHNWNDFVFISE